MSHASGHFESLHEARPACSRDWTARRQPRARHAGILFLPDPDILSIVDAARVVDELPTSTATSTNGWRALRLTSGGQEVEVGA